MKNHSDKPGTGSYENQTEGPDTFNLISQFIENIGKRKLCGIISCKFCMNGRAGICQERTDCRSRAIQFVKLAAMISCSLSPDCIRTDRTSAFFKAFRYSMPRMLFGSFKMSAHRGSPVQKMTAVCRAAGNDLPSFNSCRRISRYCSGSSTKRPAIFCSRGRSLHSLPKQTESTIPRLSKREIAPRAKIQHFR